MASIKDAIFSPQTAQDLRRELQHTADFHTYFLGLEDKYHRNVLFPSFSYFAREIIARGINSEDRTLSDVFYRGGLLGMNAVRFAVNNETADYIQKSFFDINPDLAGKTATEQDMEYASYICDLGNRGYARAKHFQPVIEEFEDRLFPGVDPRRQLLGRRGFGVIMGIMWRADYHQQYQQGHIEMLKLQANLEQGQVDLDQELAELTGSD